MIIDIQNLRDKGFKVTGVEENSNSIQILSAPDKRTAAHQQECLTSLLDACDYLTKSNMSDIAHEVLSRIETTQLFNIIKNQ